MGECVAVALGLSLAAGTTVAQIDEIVVSATKRGEVSAQEVPGGIRAISGNFLDDFQIRDVSDFARLDPSLNLASQGVGDTQLIIRGIQSPGASTVGLYFGEAVISGANFEDGGGRSPNVKLYDIERIEILKGPQGTLFGASSMSGTVRIIPAAPDASAFDAAVGASGAAVSSSSDGSWHVDGMLNLPIVEDALALRAVGWLVENAGFIDHTIPTSSTGLVIEDANRESTRGGRVSALWTPTNQLRLSLTAMYQDIEVGGVQGFNPDVGRLQTGVSPPPAFPVFSDDIPGLASPYTQSLWDEDLNLLSAVLEYDMGIGDVVASVSYFDREMLLSLDTTPVAYSFFLPGHPKPFGPPSGGAYTVIYPLIQTQDRSQLSSELRMSTRLDGPFNATFGVFFGKDDNFNNLEVTSADTETGIPFCYSIAECLATGQGSAITYGRTVESDFKQWAGFFNGTYELTEQWSLTAGIRLFRSEQRNIEFITQNVGPPPTPPAPIQGGVNQEVPIPTLDLKSTENKVTYDFNLAYAPNVDQLFYVALGSGFRAGGINSPGLAGSFGEGVPTTFEPDSLVNYEVGAKTAWFGGRVLLNGAAFLMDWSDMQVPGVLASGATDFVSNASKARVLGAEFELQANPVSGLILTMGANWTDAKLTQDQADPDIDVDVPLGFDGDRIPKVPRWAFSGAVQYTRALGASGLDAILGANVSYTGSSTTFFNDTDLFNTEIGGYFLAGLSAAISAGRWEAGIFADNVTNKLGYVDAFNSVDGYLTFPVRPRTIGLFARMRL